MNAFGGYVEEIWGWDEGLPRRIHEKDFEPDRFQIIEPGDRNTGTLGTRIGGNAIWIGHINILPIHQNSGYGARVIQTVISDVEEAGRYVKLEVLKINLARKLY